MDYSTATSWALMIARALEAKQLRAPEILREAGLDPGKLNDPHARYPVSRMRELWTLAATRSGDPAFGLFAVRFWHPTTLQALGFAWIASDTLRDALQRAARYLRLVSDAAMAQVADEDDCVSFYLRPNPGACVAPEAEDALWPCWSAPAASASARSSTRRWSG